MSYVECKSGECCISQTKMCALGLIMSSCALVQLKREQYFPCKKKKLWLFISEHIRILKKKLTKIHKKNTHKTNIF